MLKEVRFHGRGGQGAVTSSQVLAIAAFHDGRQSQAFPMFGVERRGAPVQSFARISGEKINTRQQVYEPDYVIVLDPSLLAGVDVAAGLKAGGMLIMNTDRKPQDLEKASGLRLGNLKKREISVRAIDITNAALEIIGKPFVNIAVLGAFAALTGEVSLESLKKAIDENMGSKEKIAGLNKQACEKIHRDVCCAIAAEGKQGPKEQGPKGVVCDTRITVSGCVSPSEPGRVALKPGAVIDKPGSTMNTKTGGWRSFRAVLSQEKCRRCARCWPVCPDSAIFRKPDGSFWIDYDYCKGCLMCLKECPFDAISKEVEEK